MKIKSNNIIEQKRLKTLMNNTSLKNTSLTFIENLGQIDSEVKYYIKQGGSSFFFTKNKVVFSFIRGKNFKEQSDYQTLYDLHQPQVHEDKEYMRLIFSLEFIEANSDVTIEGKEICQKTVHYFKGNDSTNWHTNIPTFEKLIYKDIWKNIDLIFYINNYNLKYDFIIHPGASVEDIKLSYKGVENLSLNEEGDLVIETQLCTLIDNHPLCYQKIGGKKITLESSFIITKGNNYEIIHGFAIKDIYNLHYDVVIDPQIIYSSYLGGSRDEMGYGIAVDINDNIYVTGTTSSLDFPNNNGFQQTYGGYEDAFVTKIDSTPAIVYSSYLGGNGQDNGNGITIDVNGNVYVTGFTGSTDFPNINAFQATLSGNENAFVTMIDTTPAIVYSSYLGGDTLDEGIGIAVDTLGNAYVTGKTQSTNFPTVNAFQPTFGGFIDGFITKINSTPAIVYSSYLGGSGWDEGDGIKVDAYGNAYVSGLTYSTNFPTVNAFQPTLGGNSNAFVTKINSTPSIVYSSYLGGNGWDGSNGIAVDAYNNVYVTGFTESINFPSVNAFQTTFGGVRDAFITKIDSTPAIVYSSFLGGNNWDEGNGIVVDAKNNIYVTGLTESTNFPTVNAFQPTFGGYFDAFVTKINSTPSIVYSSYLGGSKLDEGDGIAVDTHNNAYITGETYSQDFPIVNGFQTSLSGETDSFVTKVSKSLPPRSRGIDLFR